MKIRILLTALIISFAALPSRADITPVEASSPDYLRNHGHSGSIIEMVRASSLCSIIMKLIIMAEKREIIKILQAQLANYTI